MTRQYAPRGLGTAGRRLWREVVAAHELTAGERVILIEACRSADLCQRLADTAEKPGCLRSTRTELRAERSLLARLVRELRI